MYFIVILYFSCSLFNKVIHTSRDKTNHLDKELLYSDGFIGNSLRFKRSGDHVTPEEASRIKNESNVLVKKLINLGTKTHKILHNLPARKGDVLLEALTEYNAVFEKYLELIKHDNINTKEDVERFLGQRHPNIAETDHQEWDARTRFNWADDNYRKFEELMYAARQMWMDLIYVHAYY